MRHQICAGLFFCFLLSIISCASTMSMLVDVENPASVTLPVTAQNVIIVNNALPQPMGYGVTAPSGKYPEVDSLYAETLRTASWQVIAETFKYLDNSGFFPIVSLYKRNLREDNEWLTIVAVDEEIKKDFFENEDFDLLIAVNRLLFNSTIETTGTELGRMKAMLVFSAYIRDIDKPIVYSLVDSVIAIGPPVYFYNGVPYIGSEEISTEMIRQISTNLGERLGKFFVPSWQTVERKYFIRSISDINRMNNTINNGKWIEAQRIWTGEFELEEKAVNQARLANNIALASEMNGEFYAAEEWATKAKMFFQEVSSKKYSAEIKYLEEYIKELQERQKNNILLDKQHGIS